MKHIGTKWTGLLPWIGITAMLVLLLPSPALATHFELSRLALHIESIADHLADDLRYTRHYGSMRQRAVSLRREASQLAESLQRNRSNSRIRSRFKDVRRSYERLEQAFFNADRRDHIPRLYREIDLLSNVFTSLSDEIYYAGLGGQNYGPFYGSSYSGISLSIPRRNDSRKFDSRRDRSRSAVNRHHGSRSTGLISPGRAAAIPPVFRGNNAAAVPDRPGGRVGAGGKARVDSRTRPDSSGAGRGSTVLREDFKFDHRSSVLDRQSRQREERREQQAQARRNPSTESRVRSGREPNARRDRSGRNSRGDTAGSRRRDQ